MTVRSGAGERGATIRLTGLPSAGRPATAAAERMWAAGRRVEVPAGDGMRGFLSAGLGSSREDRRTDVTCIGFVAELLASHGVLVLAPVTAPHAENRAAVRRHHESSGTPCLEAHVATPVEACAGREVKGLDARQAAGGLTGLSGMDDPYETLGSPDARIVTHRRGVDESVGTLLDLLRRRGIA